MVMIVWVAGIEFEKSLAKKFWSETRSFWAKLHFDTPKIIPLKINYFTIIGFGSYNYQIKMLEQITSASTVIFLICINAKMANL